jgi:hypothetical protein
MFSFDVCNRPSLSIPTFFLLLFVTQTHPLIMTSRCVLANRRPGNPEVQRMRNHGLRQNPRRAVPDILSIPSPIFIPNSIPIPLFLRAIIAFFCGAHRYVPSESSCAVAHINPRSCWVRPAILFFPFETISHPDRHILAASLPRLTSKWLKTRSSIPVLTRVQFSTM